MGKSRTGPPDRNTKLQFFAEDFARSSNHMNGIKEQE